MIRFILTAALALLAGGCSKPGAVPPPPPAPPAIPAAPAVPAGYVRHDDASLAPQDAKVIAVAKSHLEKIDGQPIDAYYRVTKTPSGFSVHVLYVNAPPGGHCTVLIFSDLTVNQVLPGA